MIVELMGVRRTYPSGETTINAVNDVDLAVPDGQMLAIKGRSGSGKTTLLNLIGGLDHPDGGTVTVCDRRLDELEERDLVLLRRHQIGFVFQTFGLVPILTAAENVEVALRLTGTDRTDRRRRVHELLDLVGLAGRANHRPYELSGGEQQRVALARALANRPAVLIADEPTGQLDSATGRVIMRLVQALVSSEGMTAIVATHDQSLIDVADRVVELRDGQIVHDATLDRP
jgi:putative ABC transport system ATP-binding protein